MNNKGLSLLELIISISLVSVVLIFFYNIIGDLNNEITNFEISLNNQDERFEVIKTIQSDFNKNKDFKNPSITITGNSNYKNIVFKEGAFVSTLNISKKTIDGVSREVIMYTSSTKKKTSWVLEKDVIIGIDDIKISNDYDSGSYVHIPIYTANNKNNKEKNNLIDDIHLYLMNL